PRPKSNEGLKKNLRLSPDGRWRWHWDPRFLDGPRAAGANRRALEAAQKFLTKSAKSRDDPHKTKQKLVAFLSRRGFTWDIVSSVAKKTLGEKAIEEE
ncbi:MAG: RecX family transcriptional regulator, partial [Bacteroidota bacterium]